MQAHSITKTCSNCGRGLLSCPGTIASVTKSGTLQYEIGTGLPKFSLEFYFFKCKTPRLEACISKLFIIFK